MSIVSNAARTKYWCGTDFQLDRDYRQLGGLQYAIWQHELCESTGRHHLQFHLEFIDRLRFSQVQKMLPGAHVEACRDIEKSRKYASKSDSRVEGPFQFGTMVRGKRKAVIIHELAVSTVYKVVQENPDLWWKVQHLQRARNLVMPKRSDRTGLVYVYGPTGCGKTLMMDRMGKWLDIFWHDGDVWWDGYDGQPIVVVDEYHGEWNDKFILKLGDYVPLSVPIKGGKVQFSSILVVFLSNLPPERTIFSTGDELVKSALRRRFSVINLG